MSDPIIRVEGLGKKYRLHHAAKERYTALRDVMARRVKKLFQPGAGIQAHPAPSDEDFWALRDVSFDIQQGEVVGIIGRNGAGKSTLLKILSRITEPTTGRITLNGRVASLLEVGTGFHPELTGRENIFLNGAILGMSQAEIRAKFDEIVAFAEVERFLDTPVKRYSSGMYVRLAFAVAAHLEPEILIVDEVLAVGDAQFQKKCLGKMGDVARSGRTVLFVSHNMAAVENLCQTGIVLEKGRLALRGAAREAIGRYLSSGEAMASLSLRERADRRGNGVLRFTEVRFLDGKGGGASAFACGEDARIDLDFVVPDGAALRQVQVALGVDNSMGQRVTVWSTNFAHEDLAEVPPGAGTVTLRVPHLALMPGRYTFNLFSSVKGEIADWIFGAGSFDVEGGDFHGSGRLPGVGEAIFASEHAFELAGAARN